MFALVDCNNFYVSCERIFNPRLRNRPCVVLSNNDGCVISRSNEAKEIEIPMGAPFFKWKPFFRKHRVAVKSSNYALYGDISERVMSILGAGSGMVEVYSIDEAFLKLSERKAANLIQESIELKQRVYQWTGMPISIGIAPTKTLAKIANHIAKKQTSVGVCQIKSDEPLFNSLAVSEVWGIGRQNSISLQASGINTVQQLKDCSDKWIRKRYSIVMLKTVKELRGEPCFALETTQKDKKSIMCSRSFGRPISKLSELKETISTYTSRAAEKVRLQNSVATVLYVSVKTNRYSKHRPQYRNSNSEILATPSADSRTLIKIANTLLEEIYREGYLYHKACIGLHGLLPANQIQGHLFLPASDSLQSKSLMQTLDTINTKYGEKTMHIATNGISQNWQGRCDNSSPCFTTNWRQLPNVLSSTFAKATANE